MNDDRKNFLWLNFLVFLVYMLTFVSPLFPYSDDWVYKARIAGAEMFKDLTDIEIYERLAAYRAQRVSVIEGDSELSNYFTIAQYDSEMAFITRVAKIAHSLDLKLVWYYPSLEVLTPDGEKSGHFSMYKDHPDWVQYNIDNDYSDLTKMTPNVFYGGLVFWVDPGAESAWMCHLSPYRDYFFERIRKLVATGVDGVWIDVPLFNDIVGVWCCSNPYCRQKFEKDTSMKFPTKSDLENFNLNFRRWMIWRHTEINQFLIDLKDEARKVNPNFEVIIEIVTCDYNSATHQGLDGSFMGEVPGLTFCWEIDALSDDNAMRNGQLNDWYSLIAINKFCRGASGFKRPAWAFTYGLEENDAELVMAEAIAAQINPYETKIPLMTTNVSPQYRARMFSFIANYQEPLFSGQSLAKVAILYSSSSRDFIDYDAGTALYVTTAPPDPQQQWWTYDEKDGLLETEYLAEYRGWVNILVAKHIPFDIIPIQYLNADLLKKYQTLIMPHPVSISKEASQLLVQYLKNSGIIIATGYYPFTMDEFGAPVTHNITTSQITPNGFYTNRLIGKGYLKNESGIEIIAQNALNKIPSAARLISTNAPPTVHLELYQYQDDYILHLINFNALTGNFSPQPVTFDIKLQLPEKGKVNEVVVASSDAAYNSGALPFAASASGEVFFKISMYLFSTVFCSFDESPTPLFNPVDLPNHFNLVNNYPNPFTQSTTITLLLNFDNNIELTIYDLMGRTVRSLMKGFYAANTYKIIWDGTNDNGAKVANGIYFCRVIAGTEEKVIKLSMFQQKIK
ncbi:T9SS type A sorting domain-containing protein [candidate division KSB1 bacterium]|nr:T9SS type A sorting domain-containing protein [candidate division KSB1 bacterium]